MKEVKDWIRDERLWVLAVSEVKLFWEFFVAPGIFLRNYPFHKPTGGRLMRIIMIFKAYMPRFCGRKKESLANRAIRAVESLSEIPVYASQTSAMGPPKGDSLKEEHLDKLPQPHLIEAGRHRGQDEI
jgi:hypothetical protein